MLKFCGLFAVLVILYASTAFGDSNSNSNSKPSQVVKWIANSTGSLNGTMKNWQKESCPASCLKPKNSGMCWMNLSRWFFNAETKKCETFQYGGCRGNSNRFMSKDACKSKCGRCRNQDLAALTASSSDRSDGGDDKADCDCNYYHLNSETAGCKIVVAAPIGWKCQCKYQAWKWACTGHAIRCNKSESCPGNCFSKDCCKRGAGEHGNCGGYPPSRKMSTSTTTSKPRTQ